MTGRYLVTLQPDAQKHISARLEKMGLKAARPLPRVAMAANPLPQGSHLPLNQIGVTLVDPKPTQEDSLHQMAANESGVLAIEPERIVRAVDVRDDYLRGWRDAVDTLSAKLLEQPGERLIPAAAAAEAALTWGLSAIKVGETQLSGAGIKIAILDTGMDIAHPDFAQRKIITKNFVGDQAPFHDGVGHGTHCVGTSSGPLQPPQGPRYGIAYGAIIYVGRVLDDTGHGGDFNILEGINWAIDQRCAVISLSLGAPWLPGNPAFSQAYETAAQKALAAGCLLVVAAGNDADDPQYVGAVGTPGNSPSVLTVAAVDRNLATAPFSNRVQPDAPGVKGPDIAGPGVDIYSSWPVDRGRYNTISGTSMATPHVAGIAALFAQFNGSLRGQRLKDEILNNCMPLSGAGRRGEIGRGFVQAPNVQGSSSRRGN
jgi:subtilisin family serine protease